jgi:hypothetical protein
MFYPGHLPVNGPQENPQLFHIRFAMTPRAEKIFPTSFPQHYQSRLWKWTNCVRASTQTSRAREDEEWTATRA